MTRHLFQDLDRLSDDLLRLTSAVEEALSRALHALMARDPVAAEEVVAGDDEIDRMEVALEEEALKILALHQPVAGDLRFLVAAIKMNNDLERIADIAANLARRARDLAAMEPVEPPEGLEEMAGLARKMVRGAIHALIRRDAAEAERIRELDDRVDDWNRRILADIARRLTSCEPVRVDPLLRWYTAVRNLERVADLATNLAEDVIYLERGEIVRHRPA